MTQAEFKRALLDASQRVMPERTANLLVALHDIVATPLFAAMLDNLKQEVPAHLLPANHPLRQILSLSIPSVSDRMLRNRGVRVWLASIVSLFHRLDHTGGGLTKCDLATNEGFVTVKLPRDGIPEDNPTLLEAIAHVRAMLRSAFPDLTDECVVVN
jgi:hypothetical protein